jgi:hypothetical protein
VALTSSRKGKVRGVGHTYARHNGGKKEEEEEARFEIQISIYIE